MIGFKLNTKACFLNLAAAPSLLLCISGLANATAYTWKEIPAPQQITVPAGNATRKVCSSINAVGQVACNFQIVENLTPTALDRGRIPKVFASYAYKWDSNAPTSATNPLLLSTTDSTTLDNAAVINDFGTVGGWTDTTLTKKPQATKWIGVTPTLFGLGAITGLNDRGDYIKNNRLFVKNRAVNFPGSTQPKVQALNPSATIGTPILAGGTQSFSSTIGQSGTGMLYKTAPAADAPKPWFALSSIITGFGVKKITDNGNFVMSGLRGTAGGLFTYNCAKGVANCQVYFPTVGSASANKDPRWIALNGVSSSRNAVGTDGGLGIRIDPPSISAPNGKEVFLSLEPGIVHTGLSVSEATDINNIGQIIASGIAGSNRSFFLLTPTP